MLDLLVSGLGIILLFPFFLLIGLIIRLDSQGPVFYLQERVGLKGMVFKLIKFRTMTLNADRGTAITIGRKDSRITGIGYYLRKYKLDELPQLINVWRGEMSLVGPRPELQKFVDLYNKEQLRIISLKPGITDYASIEFRNENEMLEGKPDPVSYYITEIMPIKLQLNLRYLEQQSLWVDIKIIGQTVWLLIAGR